MLLKSLGKMTPEERQTQSPAINALKTRVNGAIATRQQALKQAAIAARLEAERVDVTYSCVKHRQSAAVSTQ